MDSPGHSKSPSDGRGVGTTIRRQHQSSSPAAFTGVRDTSEEITGEVEIMVLTIEENLEEAIETFARLTVLGHCARAADFFATTLEGHLHLFPVFAEYANFLIQQGTFDILLSLIEHREATDPEEKVYVGLLRALSLLHRQGKLADALKACDSFDSDWIRPPEELSEIQIRSVEIYIAIITDVFSLRPSQYHDFSDSRFWSVTVCLPGQERYDALPDINFGHEGHYPLHNLQTWCGQLGKSHSQEAANVLRMLLKVAPFQSQTISKTPHFRGYSHSSSPGVKKKEIDLESHMDLSAADQVLFPWFKEVFDNMDNSNKDPPSTLAKVDARNSYLSLLFRFVSLKQKARFSTSSTLDFAMAELRSDHLLGKVAVLLDDLYGEKQDTHSQQYLELQLNRHKLSHVLSRRPPGQGLRAISAIAQEEANRRINSQCLETMIYTQKVNEDSLLWSAPIRTSFTYTGLSDISATHDVVGLVGLLLHFDHSLAEAPSSSSSRSSLILVKAAAIGIFESVKLLLEIGYSPLAKSKKGRTALHLAAYHGREQIARLILEYHAGTSSQKDEVGLLPLHLAAEHGRESLVQLLMEWKESHIHQHSTQGLTALHLAAKNGHETIVTSLLEHGASVEARDQDGWTPLHWASSRWHYGVVYLLLRHGADANSRTNDGTIAVDLAAKCGHRAMILLLLANQADIHTPSKDHKSALHFAVEHGDEDLVTLLLDQGATTLSKDRCGNTALHFAARMNNCDIANLLLNNGADITGEGRRKSVHAENEDGDTALHTAAEEGHLDMVECLLVHGADTHQRNHMNRTAFYSAVKKGYTHIVELLLRFPLGDNASRPEPEVSGEAALESGERFRHEELTMLLREAEAEESQTDTSSSGESDPGT